MILDVFLFLARLQFRLNLFQTHLVPHLIFKLTQRRDTPLFDQIAVSGHPCTSMKVGRRVWILWVL